MSTTKTHMVIKTTKSDVNDKSVLEARAARFKSLANTSPSTTTNTVSSSKPTPTSANKTVDPEMAEKLARRAARFADVNTAPAISTTGKVSTSSGSTNIVTSSVVDAEKLAKRAARFSDVNKKD